MTNSKKHAGAYVCFAAAILAAIGLVMYLAQGNAGVVTLVFLVLAVVLGAAGFFVRHFAADVCGLLAMACVTYALCRYLYDSITVFLDAMNGITMFGGSASLASVTAVLVLLLLSALCFIVSCFMKRVG